MPSAGWFCRIADFPQAARKKGCLGIVVDVAGWCIALWMAYLGFCYLTWFIGFIGTFLILGVVVVIGAIWALRVRGSRR